MLIALDFYRFDGRGWVGLDLEIIAFLAENTCTFDYMFAFKNREYFSLVLALRKIWSWQNEASEVQLIEVI